MKSRDDFPSLLEPREAEYRWPADRIITKCKALKTGKRQLP